ncbi:DnaJ family domain-containing protein [Desulfovibrio psychrotolerans]|uniref:DUF1992 domain-containing protein n=1 Tax=Desulfovibrio psychrotolerans TaxID=415242 RepID=A0A7J0BZC2_9BACT|nr:DnaJ family domain-containing protein [Desulfovibrio psychrotolerans]GFM38512.1 DUF1992 domain-containing protein [Desulfovibrio psychrotolerans]
MNILAVMAERHITKAEEQGAFRNLEGQGKPLELQDDSMIPPDLRMAYKLLKNAGYLPPEAQDIKDATTIIEMLQNSVDEQTCYRQMRKLEAILERMKQQGRASVALNLENEYYAKVLSRVPVRKKV